jgi:hypothetical protein
LPNNAAVDDDDDDAAAASSSSNVSTESGTAAHDRHFEGSAYTKRQITDY